MSGVSARLRWLIALTPVFPPLAGLSLYFLRCWRRLGRPAGLIALFYLATQLLAAALTPNPALSLPLSALRSAYVLSLILLGACLGDRRWLRWLLPGMALVFATALLTSLLVYGPHFYARRLLHPYYTTSALGITAATAVWILLDYKRASPWLRGLLGLLALAVLMLSGSRGAIAALAAGALAAAVAGGRDFALALGAGGFFLGLRYLQLRLAGWAAEFHRMFSLNPSGRQEVWQRAWKAFASHPWGGVGPYQLGPWLNPQLRSLEPWEGAAALGLRLPGWAASLQGAWLIAHNTLLQALGETGVVGAAGYLALLALVGYAAVRSREPLFVAIFFGFVTMGLVDNPMAVPSLHFAEVFWVAGGMALARSGLAVPLEQGLAVDQDQPGPDPL